MEVSKLIEILEANEEEVKEITQDDIWYRDFDHKPKTLVSKKQFVVYVPKYFRLGNNFFVRYYREDNGELIKPCKKCSAELFDKRCSECLVSTHKEMLKKKKKV